jgi:hypothetical protein
LSVLRHHDQLNSLCPSDVFPEGDSFSVGGEDKEVALANPLSPQSRQASLNQGSAQAPAAVGFAHSQASSFTYS